MIKIFACGDIVINSHRDKIISDKLKKLISSADISICNFEGPMESDGISIPKVGLHINQAKNAMKILKQTGFNILSLANNHIMDFGWEGLNSTLKSCEENGLLTTGAGVNIINAFKPAIIKVEGVTVSVLSFAEKEFGAIDLFNDKPGYAWILDPFAIQSIRNAKQSSDIVIVCAHGGNEEVPFPPIQRQLLLRQFVDEGADIVIGHHPHVPQGWEKHKNGYIFYSLGNFFFDFPDGKVYPKLELGVCVEIGLDDKTIRYVEVIPVERISGQFVDIKRMGRENYLSYLKELNCITSDDSKLLPFWQETAVYLFYDRYIDNLRKSRRTGSSLCDNFKMKIKRLLHSCPKKDKMVDYMHYDKLLLLSLFRNESHKWAIETALATLGGDIPDHRTNEVIRRFNKYLEWTKI